VTSARSTLELLSDAERGRVLHQLLESHPELRDEAERLALDLLTRIDRDTVAVEAQIALEAVSTAEVAAASGRQRGGYVDHLEASSLLLEASVEPFIERLPLLAEADHSRVAAEIGTGILDGLELAKGDDESAIFFDEQFAEMHADYVIDEMERAGLVTDP
jgi:hypothetical protein